MKMRGRGFDLLVLLGLLSLVCAEEEILSKPDFQPVLLSETELKYLNERLQTKDHLNRDDAINAILELEHFYTLMKNTARQSYSPSAMVDLAWHQHILHTQMYVNFSRQYFNINILHHLPFWSGNIDEVLKEEEANPGKKVPRLPMRL